MFSGGYLVTFDDREQSRYGAQPIECFHFEQGANDWKFTSADMVVTLPVGEFQPIPISRNALEFSEEDTGETIEVKVPRDNSVAALFIGDLPSSPVRVTIYRAHRGDETLAISWFVGQVWKVEFQGTSQAVLVCKSVIAQLERAYPIVLVQAPCNHVLYSNQCKANPTTSRDLVTISTVDGVTIVSGNFAGRADQWYQGGTLQTLDGSERRFIADHVGDTVTLISRMPGLQSGAQVWAVWGCSHLEDACLNKFANLDNFLGFPRIPKRNPYEGRID